MTVPTIDTHEFTRRGDVAAGAVPIADLERLGSLLVGHDGDLSWRLAGRSELGADGSRRAFLHLDLSGGLTMRCVRCLEPVDVPLAVSCDYRLVATEAQAEAEDADEDEVDLLVASRRFDLAALIEDEAIMALPPAPRHDDCRAPAIAPPREDLPAGSDRPNPFATLRTLRDDADADADADAGAGAGAGVDDADADEGDAGEGDADEGDADEGDADEGDADEGDADEGGPSGRAPGRR